MNCTQNDNKFKQCGGFFHTRTVTILKVFRKVRSKVTPGSALQTSETTHSGRLDPFSRTSMISQKRLVRWAKILNLRYARKQLRKYCKRAPQRTSTNPHVHSHVIMWSNPAKILNLSHDSKERCKHCSRALQRTRITAHENSDVTKSRPIGLKF